MRAPPHWSAPPLLGLVLALAGCGADPPFIAEAIAVISGAAIPVFHRTPADIAISVISGRDCSIVHLDTGRTYCTPREPPPEPPLFCTRSLGIPDCWADPSKLPGGIPREIADGPRELTPRQERDRTRAGFGLW